MNMSKKSAASPADSASIDARRKSLITVLARVLARELELLPKVAEKTQKTKRN